MAISVPRSNGILGGGRFAWAIDAPGEEAVDGIVKLGSAAAAKLTAVGLMVTEAMIRRAGEALVSA
jgi:hypothetical protein